jgi:hypothetical protein
LLTYCERDTLAMVRLAEFFSGGAGTATDHDPVRPRSPG